MKNATMMKVKVMEGENETFALITLNKECPYIEGLFNFERKILTVINSVSFETLQLIPKINEDGNYTASKTHKSGYKHERLRLTKHFDAQLTTRDEIQRFVDHFTGAENDLAQYFIVPPKKEEPATVDSSLQANKKLEVVKDGK